MSFVQSRPTDQLLPSRMVPVWCVVKRLGEKDEEAGVVNS
jgi:hypothetical protein